MNPLELYRSTAMSASRATTRAYSTSFSGAVRLLHHRFRDPIHSIYGFVRFADEIVDSFHTYDQRALLARFEQDTWAAIDQGISLNPILHAFQDTVRRYALDRTHIAAFLRSMAMDLDRREHDRTSFAAYVHGSAEVVGLLCLRVFCEGDSGRFDRLAPVAMKLGAALQKINFLRDLRDDRMSLGRSYFPGLPASQLTDTDKRNIEADIEGDLDHAAAGIRQLPAGCRLGVYVAYRWYRALFRAIKSLPCEKVMDHRVRLPDRVKLALLMKGVLRHNLNLI